ncbi:ATP-dependent helicase [Terricaulis sp.]|uniref:ATP-dependent helicase n=1 Tax=Terricaulis sp. TaxID=2768686 RepID=UPI0037851A16
MSRIASATKQNAFDDLNDAQRAAVEHGSGPLLVIAGAGSGKTKTLSCRVARLIADGADPNRILLLTFSRRAATEMTRRVAATIAGAEVTLPWSGTFHAIGARLLRELGPIIGLSPDFTIHDRGDSADLMGLARHECGFGAGPKRFPMKSTCLSIYSRAINAEEPLSEVLAQTFPWCRNWEAELKQLFAKYVEMKQAQSVLDYDDLLLYWAEAMEQAEIAEEIAARFDHVLVDEYQDTNRLQARILMRLKPDGQGVTVVGDDAQSIYSFRAATVRNILDFPAAYAPAARVVTLEENYRSTQSILDASNAVIERSAERFTKNLRTTRNGGPLPRLVDVRDEAEQAHYVCDEILAAREGGLELKQQAVLFRAADHSAQVELELQRRDIPFIKFGGLKFLEAAHVKDLIAILRWGQNGSDRLAGFRALQLVPGVGPAKAQRMLDAPPERAFEAAPAPSQAQDVWEALRAVVESMRSGGDWPADLERAAQWYEPVLEARYDDARVRAADISTLVRLGANYPSREIFLTDLTLDPPNSTSDESGPPHRDDDFVILSTIHSAKGQEWRNVFMLNAVDGCIPSDLATGSTSEIEEERRLLYVAMTRAKDNLHVVVPQRFYVTQQAKNGDRNIFAARTRFIPAELTRYFERTSYARPSAGGAARPSAAPVDLSAKARARWS